MHSILQQINAICTEQTSIEDATNAILEVGPITAYATYKIGKKALQNKDNIKKVAQVGVELYHNVKQELEAKKAAEKEHAQKQLMQRQQNYQQQGHYYDGNYGY